MSVSHASREPERNDERPHVLVICLDPGILWSSPKGASVHLRAVARGLSEIGCRVALLTHDGLADCAGGAEASETDAPPRFAEVAGAESAREYFAAPMGRVGSELRTLAKMPPFLEAARRLHDTDPFDCVYERYSLWSAVGARLAKEITAPFVVEVNAPLIREQDAYRELSFRSIAEAVELEVLAAAQRIITVSRALAAELNARGVAGGEILHLPNTADRAHFYRGPFTPPREGEPFVIGFSGSLKPWHGLSQFLEVFRLVHAKRPATRLEILGDGRDRQELQRWVIANGLSGSVHFHGHVDHARVPDVMHGWHLTVAPYPALDDFYFSPLKIAEALAAGKVVMASSLGEIPDMLGGGARGRLVEPGNWTAWERSLLEMIDAPRRLEPLAAAAEEWTRSWSWREHVARSMRGILPETRKGRMIATLSD